MINSRQNKDLEFIFQVGVSPNFYNQKLGVSPIHVAANEGESEKVGVTFFGARPPILGAAQLSFCVCIVPRLHARAEGRDGRG